ncbi:MAG: carbohydrate kinase family protein [Spirochaetaceae bacterium]
MKQRIVGVGNPLWDVFAPVSSNPHIAGRFDRGSSNHLSAEEMEEILTRLSDARWVAGGGARNSLAVPAAFGYRTYLSGTVGSDGRGFAYRGELSTAGIADCLSSADAAPTGTCVTLIHETGEPTVIVAPAAALELLEPAATAPRDPDVVMFEGFLAPRAGLAESTVAYVARAGATFVVDLGHPGVASAAVSVVESAARDLPGGGEGVLVFGTEAEVAATAAGGNSGDGDALSRGLARLSACAGVVVVKRAERGAAVYRGGRQTASASPSVATAPKETVVDTTGAGDVFAGAFLVALLRGIPDDHACELADLAAGMSLSNFGGHLRHDQLRILAREQ